MTRGARRALAAGLALALFPVAALPAPARDPRWATPIAGGPGLPHLHRVGGALYRGAQPTAAGFRELERMGVRSVINLRAAHSDRAQMRAAGVGLRYHHVSFKPWHPEDEDVIEFLRILADPANLPAFVHCQHGADRTGTMVAIYRIVAEGWTVEEALAEMTGGGFGFHRVWRGLKTYLRQMDAEALAVKAGLRETEEDR